jgi:hypothetical protein
LSLLRASGETDLAGGMQRLARLAAAAHRQQLAAQHAQAGQASADHASDAVEAIDEEASR